MSDTERLLELIENCIVEHGGDLGGWTRREGETLQLFDGRLTLHAELKDAGPAATAKGAIHAHVFTTLHEYEDEEGQDASIHCPRPRNRPRNDGRRPGPGELAG